MSLVAVKKRKSGKNRKDRNKVDRKVRKKGKFPVCVFSSSSGSRPIRLQYLCYMSIKYIERNTRDMTTHRVYGQHHSAINRSTTRHVKFLKKNAGQRAENP